MKILFVNDYKYPKLWLDGLYGALQELERTHKIDYYNLNDKNGEPKFDSYDFVLGHGGFNSPVDNYLIRNIHKIKKCGLCIGGNATMPREADKYSVLFYETDWVREFLQLSTLNVPLVKAFGINTDIYSPIEYATPLVFDYLGVGSFSDWKRWDKFKNKDGIKMIVGEFQENNPEESTAIVKDLMLSGIGCMPTVHPFDLSNLNHWSRTVYIPASIFGGGERAVLEARACGCNVEIEDDNPKLKELLDCEIPSHIDYAKQLEKGILKCALSH